ncbi:MAG: hypothetical protein AAF797_00055 [Planctomycetota bacterium]
MPQPTRTEPTQTEWLQLPPSDTLHEDKHTHVYRTTLAPTPVLIKHFKAPAVHQRLAARFNRHPAQREALWQQRLAELGLPAAQPLDHTTSPTGQHALVYPDLGQHLPQWWQHQHPNQDHPHRVKLAQYLGQLLARLAAVHVLWPNARAVDFFVAPNHTLHFINAGSCRGARGIPLLARLLPLMQQLQADLRDASKEHAEPLRVQPTATDRLRVYRAMLHTFPEPLDGLQHLPSHTDLK